MVVWGAEQQSPMQGRMPVESAHDLEPTPIPAGVKNHTLLGTATNDMRNPNTNQVPLPPPTNISTRRNESSCVWLGLSRQPRAQGPTCSCILFPFNSAVCVRRSKHFVWGTGPHNIGGRGMEGRGRRVASVSCIPFTSNSVVSCSAILFPGQALLLQVQRVLQVQKPRMLEYDRVSANRGADLSLCRVCLRWHVPNGLQEKPISRGKSFSDVDMIFDPAGARSSRARVLSSARASRRISRPSALLSG